MSVGERIATGRRQRTQAAAQTAICDFEKRKIKTVNCGTEKRNVRTEKVEAEKAPTAHAFGHTFVLAPAFCLKIGREDNVLMAAFAQHEGLAILVHSEFKATDRVADLLRNETEPCDALIGADALLCPSAQRLLAEPNAGGASRISEAISMEVLSRAFGASLVHTELEILYWPACGSIADFEVELQGTHVGVSVTRAMTAPHLPFDEAAARVLLEKKLNGAIRSTETCLGAWRKCVLHVWAPTAAAAAALETAYATLPDAMRSDTVVLVTTCEGLPALFDEKMSRNGEKAPKVLKGLKGEEHLRVLAESDPCSANRLGA